MFVLEQMKQKLILLHHKKKMQFLKKIQKKTYNPNFNKKKFQKKN